MKTANKPKTATKKAAPKVAATKKAAAEMRASRKAISNWCKTLTVKKIGKVNGYFATAGDLDRLERRIRNKSF